MLHVRVVSPPSVTGRLLDRLAGLPGVRNLIVLEGAAHRPVGDAVFLDVDHSAANPVFRALRGVWSRANRRDKDVFDGTGNSHPFPASLRSAGVMRAVSAAWMPLYAPAVSGMSSMVKVRSRRMSRVKANHQPSTAPIRLR